MRSPYIIIATLCAIACGQEGNPVVRSSASPVPEICSSIRFARNQGTQVWFVPVPAGDLMKLAQQPELWPKAQGRVDVVSLYFGSVYYHEGYECGLSCGPNTYVALREAVPGGMFQWLSDRFILAFEGASVKSYACTDDAVRQQAMATNVAISNIERSGGRLSYVSLDEPFSSGVNQPNTPGFGGCGLSMESVSQLQRIFNDTVHSEHPEVQIGFIEPYPRFTADEIMSLTLELERTGVAIPYFHLDMHLQSVVREKSDVQRDLGRMRKFFSARGIPFGVIVFGSDGRSNGEYAAEAWATARLVASIVGVTEHTVFQSWAEARPGDMRGLKNKPDTVPESDPFTHTGLILGILEYLRVNPAL